MIKSKQMVAYDINDKYCPCGAKWIRVEASIFFGDYYYCEKCDKIYIPTVKVRTKKWFVENYTSDRRKELINIAHIVEARKKVTIADLKKLGYL